jgi:hypothetical protein
MLKCQRSSHPARRTTVTPVPSDSSATSPIRIVGSNPCLITCCNNELLIAEDLLVHGIVDTGYGIRHGQRLGNGLGGISGLYCRHEDRQWKLRYSSAYHQHHSPCEHLWARLNGLCTNDIAHRPVTYEWSTGTTTSAMPTTYSFCYIFFPLAIYPLFPTVLVYTWHVHSQMR